MATTSQTPLAGPGQALRAMRVTSRIQLTEVAEAANTSISYLSEVENGKRIPTKAYLARVTEAIAQLIRAA